MRRIHLVQIGAGLIGGTAIDQVLAQRARWRDELGLDVNYAAMVGSDGAIVAEDENGFTEEALRAALAARQRRESMDAIAAAGGHHRYDAVAAIAEVAAMGAFIAVDTAAGSATAAIAERALSLGGGMVFSNKAPLSLPTGDGAGGMIWNHAGPNGKVRYETTCGAGLPIISTLRTLLETGDAIIELAGTVSGTFGAIFSDVAAGRPFSAAVRGAKERGYTEPDPRDDLSGLDVARKALILARTIGREVDLTDIAIESLVPESLRDCPVEEYLARVDEQDAAIAARAAEAKVAGKTLKYVAVVRPEGPIDVGLRPVETSTVLGALQGPENIVTFRTARYDAYPINITGPGAGAAVTAAGVLGDTLALASGPIGG